MCRPVLHAAHSYVAHGTTTLPHQRPHWLMEPHPSIATASDEEKMPAQSQPRDELELGEGMSRAFGNFCLTVRPRGPIHQRRQIEKPILVHHRTTLKKGSSSGALHHPPNIVGQVAAVAAAVALLPPPSSDINWHHRQW
mmetsp:Transcript_13390/g.29080  ORF Transcript_13390/g.29080 Transcript_13390/m.29080 type:complete len:139 (-) Transcript_13390:668-1084(-)